MVRIRPYGCLSTPTGSAYTNSINPVDSDIYHMGDSTGPKLLPKGFRVIGAPSFGLNARKWI